MFNEENIETFSGTIQAGIDASLKNLHTCLPCIIESFDKDALTCRAQPVVKRIYIDPDTQEKTIKDIPLLINIPVIFPKGGGFSLTFPIKKGDECVVFFAERAIDDWHNSGEVKKQNQKRFHDLSDGMAFVGLCSKPNVLTGYDDAAVQLRSDDGNTSISVSDDNKIKMVATEIEVTGKLIVTGDQENTGNVDVLGDIKNIGQLGNNGILVGSTHIHTQPNDGGGDTESPVLAPVVPVI